MRAQKVANLISFDDGFIEASLSLSVPHGKGLYIKLRGDPATVDTVVLPTAGAQ